MTTKHTLTFDHDLYFCSDANEPVVAFHIEGTNGNSENAICTIPLREILVGGAIQAYENLSGNGMRAPWMHRDDKANEMNIPIIMRRCADLYEQVLGKYNTN